MDQLAEAIREEARYYLWKIENHLGSFEEVVAWADYLILQLQEPDPPLLDLLLVSDSAEAVMALLALSGGRIGVQKLHYSSARRLVLEIAWQLRTQRLTFLRARGLLQHISSQWSYYSTGDQRRVVYDPERSKKTIPSLEFLYGSIVLLEDQFPWFGLRVCGGEKCFTCQQGLDHSEHTAIRTELLSILDRFENAI